MINKKYFDENFNIIDRSTDKEYLFRLKSTLKNRLNLLNIFMPLVEKSHKPRTIYNLGINLNDIKQIERFLRESTENIEKLSTKFIELFSNNGSSFQRKRVLKYFIK